MSIEDFMKSPLVRWVQLFKPDPLTYGNLCDGAFLGDVMRQIDPGANLIGMNVMATEFRDRLQNWDLVINSILSYYQTVLQQFVIMRLPNIVTIGKLPYSEICRQELQRALLLVLGCAVQCEQKQSFIEKIKSLDLSDQKIIMHSITEVTDCPANILSAESLGEKLDDPSKVLQCSYVTQLLRERQENRSQIQDVTIALEELQKEKDEKSGQSSASGVDLSNVQFASDSRPSKSKNNVNLPGQIRRLQRVVDEKTAENQELHEELDRLNRTAEKLRNENVDLIKEASAARAYRDELDIVQEKANSAKKYELENTKLREKLNELDFLRAHVKEIRLENSLLLESKLEIEEKLLMREKQNHAVCDLEEQLDNCKRHLEEVAAERDSERRKLHELSEENTRLVLEQRASQSRNNSLEEELKLVQQMSDSSTAISLSEQLSEMATSKLRRLELENQHLRKEMAENKNESSTLESEELKNENERLRSKVETLGQTVAEDERTVDELRQLKLLEINSEVEEGSKVLSQRVRPNEKGSAVRHFQDKNEDDDVVEDRIRNIENENKRLATDFQSVRSNLAKTSLDHQQLMIIHEAFTSDSSQQIKTLEQEKDALDRENVELRNTVAGLRLVFERYSDAEKTASELRVENEKLTKKLISFESSVGKVSTLEQENSRLRIDVECLQRTVENQKNSSSKLVDLEHEKDAMNRQIVQLQNSLDSSKADRITISSLEHDLEMAVDEKIRVKRHLESALSDLEASRAEYARLESRSDQLQKSVEAFETAKKKFDIVQRRNEKLEAENQSLTAGKSALEKENMRLRLIGDERKLRVEELGGKLVELEVTNKELMRDLERSHWSKAMRVRETESGYETRDADYRQDFEQTLDLEKEQQHEDLTAEQTKSTSLSAIPVLVVAPSRTSASSNSSLLSLNMMSPVTEHLDNGAYAMEYERDQVRHSPLDSARGIVDLDVELRRDIVRLERKNAVLEEETRSLKVVRGQLQTRLNETENQCSVAQSELSSIRGQCHALQTQLEKLQAESISLAPKNALLIAENASLNKECSDLKSRLSQTLEKERALSLINVKHELEIKSTSKQMEHITTEHKQLKNEHAKLKVELQQSNGDQNTNQRELFVLKSRHSELEHEYSVLQSEHSKLKSEHDELTSEHSELMMDHKSIAEQASEMEERCFQLTKAVEDLSEWKVQNEQTQVEITSERSTELAEIARLEREATDGRKSLERLQVENDRVKEKWSRMIRKQEDVEKDLSDAREQLNDAGKENNRLASKCEVLSQLQLRLEDENHSLMIQLQALMNQNQDLLTKILNSKDHYVEEQKSYLNQLSELRRQKEKLEEKLIEQSRQKDLAKKKNKGFSAFVKRAFLKDKKSKEKNKAGNDLELTQRTLSDLGLSPRTTDDHSLTSVSVNSLVTPSVSRDGNSPNGESVYRSGGDMPDGDRQQMSQQKVAMATSPKFLADGDSGEEDEQITLDEFLQECNQTPSARKKLLMEKKASTLRNDARTGMHAKDSSHRSSALTLFRPQSAHHPDNNNSMGTPRLFQSELNLFRGNSRPRSSNTSSSNITSTPVRAPNYGRRESVAHVAKTQNAELVQSVTTLNASRRSNEQSKHRRIHSTASGGGVAKRNSFCRVVTTQADVTFVTNSRLQDPVMPPVPPHVPLPVLPPVPPHAPPPVPPAPVSNTSSMSGGSSNLSESSSRQSLNDSHASHSSAVLHRTSLGDMDYIVQDYIVHTTTESADKTMNTGCDKDLVDSNTCLAATSSACLAGTSSTSSGDLSERPASSLSSSSSSARSRQNKPIPFIDEVEHEDVTFRESNVCI